ncbi:MAG: 5-(carboxyamino)imidazole ribonucleotide synthase [Alphaproteobacteria bacterium]|nr:5-(carboxyamino)imidazole ribonucleotide synthase [Alphaproteobacteria bacterium]
MKIVPPGSTIGILGGGQLGRMTALAAANLGYRCHIFCPESEAPALQVSDAYTTGSFTDEAALEKFASCVDIVTLEWENVPISTLEFLDGKVPVCPSPNIQKIAQDRILEKSFARQHGIGTADFMAIGSIDELKIALKKFPLPAVLKSTRMGYDGKGQVKINADTDAASAWQEMGGNAGILEAFVDFDCELSVIVARRADGLMVHYPVTQNIHQNHILARSEAPAPVSADVADEAARLACHMAKELGVVGLLAVEFFALKTPNASGQLVLMNEIAPRPHNSGHWTIDACSCSQFEQLIRAICGLPLGLCEQHSKAIMHNLIGDDVLRWAELLKDPSACLHIYGKTDIRAGRKMGHVTFLHDK